ncbi:hypothetical protein KR074_003879 [Drosophila pseudoananassae]|nr:hypothetical protein KR074_003879 [Drosophila pseudoananassae]
MRTIIYFVVLCILLLSHVSCGTVLQKLFPGFGGYYYPTAPAQPSYPAYYESSYRQTPRPRPQDHQRSYKDICRVVNTNGFTNPGGVPKCPF